MPKKKRKINIGDRFGLLLVVGFDGKGMKRKVICKCDCGNTKLTQGSPLGRSVISCGWGCPLNAASTTDVILTERFHYCKASAKKRGISWELTKDEFKNIVLRKCFYCGGDGARKWKYHHDISRKAPGSAPYVVANGIDRFNTALGYNYDNSVPCCYQCNTAKLDRTVSMFMEWVARIHKRCQHVFEQSPIPEFNTPNDFSTIRDRKKESP